MGLHLKDTIEGTCRKAINDEDGNNIPETYLKKDGDAKDNTVTFETDDNVEGMMQATSANPSGTLVGYKTETGDNKWHIMHPLDIKDRLSATFHKFTTLFHNVRYLYELCGKNDISKLGDGTLTGAISKLNTDILEANEVKLYRPPQPAANSIYLGFSQWDFTVTKCGRLVTVSTNLAGHMKASMDNIPLLTLPAEYAPYDEYKIFNHATQDGNSILVGIYNNGLVRFNNMGKEINSWLARWCITYIAREP